MNVTYDDLHRMLLATGFIEIGIDGPNHMFEHQPTGATFSLPLGTRPSRGTGMYAAGLMGLLDVHGILSQADFVARIGSRPRRVGRRSPKRQPAAR